MNEKVVEAKRQFHDTYIEGVVSGDRRIVCEAHRSDLMVDILVLGSEEDRTVYWNVA